MQDDVKIIGVKSVLQKLNERQLKLSMASMVQFWDTLNEATRAAQSLMLPLASFDVLTVDVSQHIEILSKTGAIGPYMGDSGKSQLVGSKRPKRHSQLGWRVFPDDFRRDAVAREVQSATTPRPPKVKPPMQSVVDRAALEAAIANQKELDELRLLKRRIEREEAGRPDYSGNAILFVDGPNTEIQNKLDGAAGVYVSYGGINWEKLRGLASYYGNQRFGIPAGMARLYAKGSQGHSDRSGLIFARAKGMHTVFSTGSKDIDTVMASEIVSVIARMCWKEKARALPVLVLATTDIDFLAPVLEAKSVAAQAHLALHTKLITQGHVVDHFANAFDEVSLVCNAGMSIYLDHGDALVR